MEMIGTAYTQKHNMWINASSSQNRRDQRCASFVKCKTRKLESSHRNHHRGLHNLRVLDLSFFIVVQIETVSGKSRLRSCQEICDQEKTKEKEQEPRRSLTARPWKVTCPKAKDRLSPIHFQGRVVKLLGVKWMNNKHPGKTTWNPKLIGTRFSADIHWYPTSMPRDHCHDIHINGW